MCGVLALVGGDEFKAGNEEHDRYVIEHAGRGKNYVLVTANRKHPDLAFATARSWFATLGCEVVELRVRSRRDAIDAARAAEASQGGMFYLAGGDPGWTVEVLRESAVWSAIEQAWKRGAALAGSSAGAMAFGTWTLVKAGPFPGSQERKAREALGVVRQAAVLPHYETFGAKWIPSARKAVGEESWLVGIDERSALVCHGQQWRAMGSGAVRLLRGEQSWDGKSGTLFPVQLETV